ncbi:MULTISPECIES: SymE family type I addiction module toxin [Pantoea]|uniref:SymE family type I addiction module toxin n=1 Tax=Pantoea sp. TaxID=69393 RepID=UPI001F01576E|nr:MULTISPECIES: SymE family type I addiction module toxin [Pantoea]MDH2125509.1 SymE family type I addiction module toxin [Pantoea brenneri]
MSYCQRIPFSSVTRLCTQQVSLAGQWLPEAGFEVGTGVSLKVLDGCLVLITDSREETRLLHEQTQLAQQQMEQT